MKQPLVTVCIPSYNHARFVGESIEGILDQTYPNIELIIIDDGSSDNSVEIIESYRNACEKRFTRFELRSRPNKGLSATLNEALEWAQGEYFSPIASDDVALPRKIETLLPVLEQDNGIAGVFGGILIVDARGGEVEPKARSGRWTFEDILLCRAHIMAPAGLLRLQDALDVGGFDEEFLIEDWSLWLKLTEGGKAILSLLDSVAKYRIHGSNTHGRVEDMHRSRAAILRRYKDHALFQKASAISAATSAIAAADQSATASFRYLAGAVGAPASLWGLAIAKCLLPARLYTAARRLYWKRR
jgi:alpha-1,3-rhamnosyltransferase